jgi:hypothetical protein
MGPGRRRSDMAKDCYHLCEEHDEVKVFYFYGLVCPLCEAEKKVEILEEKIEDLEQQEEV